MENHFYPHLGHLGEGGGVDVTDDVRLRTASPPLVAHHQRLQRASPTCPPQPTCPQSRLILGVHVEGKVCLPLPLLLLPVLPLRAHA